MNLSRRNKRKFLDDKGMIRAGQVSSEFPQDGMEKFRPE